MIYYYIVLKKGFLAPDFLQVGAHYGNWSQALKDEMIFVYGYRTTFEEAIEFLHEKQNKPSLDGLPCG